MQEDRIIQEVVSLYQRYLEQQSDDDFVVNEEQFYSLYKCADCMQRIVDSCDGRIESIDLIPREIVGGISILVPILDLYGDTLKDYIEVLKCASAMGVDVEGDQICLSVTIPDLFKQKPIN